jgi:transposase-like protein
MNRKQQAQQLYMAGKSQKEIATLISVSERTIYTWVHQFSWDKLRLAACQAPATIADNLCSQLVEMQTLIAARPAGQRFPTMEEASVSRILINSIDKMKKYPSLSNHMQVLETFRNYIRPVDREFARSLGNYTDRFLGAKAINGYVPYQLEYGVDTISPITAYYEEPSDEDEGYTHPIHCSDIDNCLHPGDCNYPACKRPELYTAPPDYNIPSFHFTPTPIPSFCHPEPAECVFLSPPKFLPEPAEGHEPTGSFPAIPQPQPEKNSLTTSPERAQSNSEGCSPSDMTPPEQSGSFPAIPQPKPEEKTNPTSPERAQSNSEECSPSDATPPAKTGSFPAIPQPKPEEKTNPTSPERAQSNSGGCSPSDMTPPEQSGSFPAIPQPKPEEKTNPTSPERAQANSERCSPSAPLYDGSYK